MPTPFLLYTLAWIAACLVAAAMGIARRDRLALASRGYRRFLARPWRIVTFAISAGALIVVAPYTGDVTWDYVDASFMSVLAFATAPWAVGALWRASRRLVEPWQAYVAACVWMFSASWSYDLYIFVRDGDYPMTWLANVGASSVLYLSAGLFWSLESRPERGVTFAFLEPEWFPEGTDGSFSKVVWYAAPFMALVAASIAYFVATA